MGRAAGIPTFECPGRPVVHNGQTKDVLRSCHFDAAAHGIAFTHIEAQLEFVIQQTRRTIDGVVGLNRQRLAARATDFAAFKNHRAGPPVVSHGEMAVIGHQWVVRPEHRAHVGGVVNGAVEVGVVTNRKRSKHGAFSLWTKHFGSSLTVVVQRRIRTRQKRKCGDGVLGEHRPPNWRVRSGLARRRRQLPALTQQSALRGHFEVKSLFADGHHGTRSFTKVHHPERKVLHWKSA